MACSFYVFIFIFIHVYVWHQFTKANFLDVLKLLGNKAVSNSDSEIYIRYNRYGCNVYVSTCFWPCSICISSLLFKLISLKPLSYYEKNQARGKK